MEKEVFIIEIEREPSISNYIQSWGVSRHIVITKEEFEDAAINGIDLLKKKVFEEVDLLVNDFRREDERRRKILNHSS